MKWQGVIAIGAVLAVSILAIVDYCLNVDINWEEVIAIGAVLAASIALHVYSKDKYWNTYRYLADLYYEIIRRGLEQPEFLNPEYTRKYKELRASNSKMYFKYDAYAKMCWTHIYDIHDTKELKKDFIELYLPTIGRYNRLHGVWLLDHTSAFSSGFVDFVLSYKWRDYLGKGAAGWVRWENVVDDFDGKILNPHLKKVNKHPFGCIEDYIKVYLKEKKNKVFVADFGCGNRKLIKSLANGFGIDNVYCIDYPDNMLEMAKNLPNVPYKMIDMTNMEEMKKIYGTIDIAFSINSILPRNPNATPIILHEIYKSLKPGGLFIAIFPSFDTVLYLKELWCKCRIEDLKERCKHRIKNFGSKCKTKLETMLEFDKHRKLNVRKRLDADDFLNVHRFIYDTDTQPLLRKAGFILTHMEKVTYHPYELCKEYDYDYFPEEEIWDWFVVAEKLKKEN